MNLACRPCDLLAIQRLPRRQVPQPQDTLVSTSEYQVLLLAFLALPFPLLDLDLDESNRLDRLEHRQSLPQYSSLEVPHVDDLVPASTDERSTIWRHVQSSHDANVPIEDMQALPRPQIPHSDPAVVCTTYQASASGSTLGNVEYECTDDPSVALEDVGAMPSSSVPHLDDTVGCSCREECSSGVRGAGDDGSFVGFGDGSVQFEGREGVEVEGEGACTGDEESSSMWRGGGGCHGERGDRGGVLRESKHQSRIRYR